MFNVIESVIKKKNFVLTDILKKIDEFWVSGALTDTQRNTLVGLAQNNANPKDADVFAKLIELEKRIQALEAENTDSTDTPSEEKIEEFVIGKWYYTTNKVVFKGYIYECVAPEGVACVWNPDEYPAYWKQLEKAPELEDTMF